MSFNPDQFMDSETGNGPRAASWKPSAVGAFIQGEVVHVSVIPVKDPSNGQPELLNGQPRQQLVITVQTSLRGWQEANPLKDQATQQFLGPEHDDGKRSIFAKQQSDLASCIKEAIVAVGASGAPKVGGTLAVQLVELRNTGKPSPLKVHRAKYTAPAAAANFDYAAPAPQAAPPQQQFAQQPQYAPPAPQPTAPAYQPQAQPAFQPQAPAAPQYTAPAPAAPEYDAPPF